MSTQEHEPDVAQVMAVARETGRPDRATPPEDAARADRRRVAAARRALRTYAPYGPTAPARPDSVN